MTNTQRHGRALVPLLFLLLSGCSYRVEKQKESPLSSAELSSSVSFETVYERVFRPNCITCHGNLGGVNLESRQSAREAIERIHQMTLVEKRMPPPPNPPLNEEERTILASWIKKEGDERPGNAPTPTPYPEPAPRPDPMPEPIPRPSPRPNPVLTPTFRSIQQQILAPKCITCHRAGGRASGIPFTSLNEILQSPYELVVPERPEESGIVLALKPGARKPMPPVGSGFPPVTSRELKAIEEWIRKGARD